MVKKKKMYPGVDIGKFICALLILFYHYFSEHGSLPGVFGEALSLYAIAVALFMSISGFLLFNKLEVVDSREDRWLIVKKQVLRIYRIYLLWSIPYLAYTIYCWEGNSITFDFVIWELQRWIFSSTFYTIWFMPMLAIGLLVTFWMTEKLPNVIVILLGAVCWIVGALSMTYQFIGLTIPGFDEFVQFSDLWLGGARGWLFYAFPLILVGRFMVSCKEKVTPLKMASLSCLFTLAILVEALLIRRISGSHTGIDLTFMMIPTVFCVLGFLISVQLPDGEYARWMRSMSVLIFMSQRLFLTVLPDVLKIMSSRHFMLNPFMNFIMICGGTVIFSALLIRFSRSRQKIGYLY